MSHEWYDRHKKDVTIALNRGKAAKPEEGVACTLVKMSDGAFLLCAHVSAPKVTVMVQEAKRNGGKLYTTGTLYKGEEGVTFAVTEGNAAVKKQFADAAAAATGKAVFVHIVEPTAPPPAPPPPPSVPVDGAAFKTRVTALATAVKGAPKEVQAAVQPDLVQALALGKAGKFAEAEPYLARVEQGLGSASAPPPPPPPPPSAPPQTKDGDKNVLKERLTALKPRYVQALQAAPPNKAVLEKAMGLVVQAVKDGDVAKGLKVLDGLEKALGMTPPPGDFAKRFAAGRERWLTAREAAGKGLSALQNALRSDPDPRFQRVGEMGLNGISGRVQVGLEIALRNCEADPAARGKARQAVADFRKFLTDDPVVGLCDVNPYNVQVGLRDHLLPALNELDGVLAG